MSNVIQGEPTRVISLRDAMAKFRPEKCRHLRIVVDEMLNEVECEDCGAKLNPIAVLVKMAHEESLWGYRGDELKKLQESLGAKSRCKCQHCGRLTRVRP